MKTTTCKLYKSTLITAAILAFSVSVQAAGYLKVEGIDGSARATQQTAAGQDMGNIKAQRGTTSRGLLLPAVQKAREAGHTASPRAGKNLESGNTRSAGDEHEVEYNIAAGA
jgi:hypothetical protein